MVIITSANIKQRGYTSLDEIILDLPGFDSTVTNGNGGVINVSTRVSYPINSTNPDAG